MRRSANDTSREGSISSRTEPPIAQAQNETGNIRLVAAQAQLYSDVKRDQFVRLRIVALLGLLASLGSFLFPSAAVVGSVGGAAALVANAVLMYRERRRSDLAASIQESFDCDVFQLRWNDVAVRRRPAGQQVVLAAARYTGGREYDWYPDTETLVRPLDVVVCQQSNVGWGAPVHRAWAWSVVTAAACVVVVFAGITVVADLSALQVLNGLVVPFSGLAWECAEMVRQHRASAVEKEDIQEQLLDDWHAALAGTVAITEERCRRYQDGIAGVRRRNAQTPDFFDKRLRARNERAMRTTATDMIEQARKAGLA